MIPKQKIEINGGSMNKKIFGIRIGTMISVILSFAVAVVFWLFVKYVESDTDMLFAALRLIERSVI